MQVLTFVKEGLVFAVAVNSSKIFLYDAKNYSAGPFLNIHVNREAQFTKLAFSTDGKLILISTDSNYILLIDSFNGELRHRLVGHMNTARIPLEASFTPDAKYVMCGSQDGPVYVWSVETGKLVTRLEYRVVHFRFHHEFPKVVAFNPSYLMFASADANLVYFILMQAFWIPPFK